MTLLVWLIVVSSAVLHATWNLAAKKVRGDVGVIAVGMGMAAVATAPLGYFFANQSQLVGDGARYLLFRGLLQTLYFITLAYAYRFGELSFIYPIARGIGAAMAAVAGAGLLHENISSVGATGIAFVVLGTFFISTHPVREKLMRGLVFAIATGITTGLMSINDKLAVSVLAPELYIFYMHVLCFLCLAPFVWIRHPRQFRNAWTKQRGMAALVGLGSMLSYFLVLFAFRLGNVSYVAPVRELAVVLGTALGTLVLGEKLTLRKAAGITAITAGVILIKFA